MPESSPDSPAEVEAATGKAWLLLATVAIGTLLLDQLFKALVLSSIRPGEKVDVAIGIKLENVRNPGVAFGLFGGSGFVVTLLVLAAVVLLIVYFSYNARAAWIWLPTGLVLGGALGNVVDRVARGSVVDYIDLPKWPTFNFADATIVVGVILLVIVAELDRRRSASSDAAE